MSVSLLLVASAWAYTLTGTFWTWQDHPIEDPFHVDADSFPEAAGDAADVHLAISSAMGTWNAVGLDATLVDGGTTTGAALSADGYDAVFHVSYSGVGAALAFAASWADDDGAMIGCDVIFLDANDYGALSWSTAWTGGTYDVESVALHELGHCLGLDHSADAGAVMYAYYTGLRALTADDTAGLAALYGAEPCADADGDGWTGCDGDCDETSALVHPGAQEVCDGVDGDCDGVVDQASTRAVSFGDGTRSSAGDWYTAGNAFTVSEATALTGISQAFEAETDARLVWAVLASTDGGATWTTLRTEIGAGVAGGTQTSPAFHEPLAPGILYAAVGGAMGASTFTWDMSPTMTVQGPVVPMGGVTSRIEVLDTSNPEPSYLWNQALTVTDRADPDEDGVTELCGDCAPDDDTLFPGNAEACDGADQDCDGEIDEDLAVDADGDGVYDCADPCPDDADDDSDGDGTCDGVDPCPDDADDACAEPMENDPGDGTGGKEAAGCACDAGAGTGGGWALLVAAAAARRRYPRMTRQASSTRSSGT